MKWTVLVPIVLVFTIAIGDANARTRSQRCHDWAHEQYHAQPRPARGAIRGAALGAVGGAVVGRPGPGAAVGAGLGAAHSASRRRRSYDYFFDRCMRTSR